MSVTELKNRFNESLTAKLKDRAAAMKLGKDAAELESEYNNSIFNDLISPRHVEYEELLDQESSTDEKAELVPELRDVDDFDLNKYISAKVQIPKDGHSFAVGKVIKRVRDDNSELIGKSNSNPLLDTSLYEVQFDDGSVEKYHANIIAEHIYEQVDDDGCTRMVIDDIIDHRSDETAVKQHNGFVVGKSGSFRPK